MIPKEIIIHHTASNRDGTTIQDIDNWHKARWPHFISSLWFFIGYHYVILGNGQVIQTRKDNEMGAHSPPNNGRIGVAVVGNFENEQPTEAQLKSLDDTIKRLKGLYKFDDTHIFGHGGKNRTLCPGRHLMQWLNIYRQISIIKKLIIKLKKIIEFIKTSKK